jgi:peptidyl-prolyl cis-trans isomerase D
VLLSKLPSAEDSAMIARDMERLRSEFAAAEDDSLFLLQQGSERPYSSSWFRADELEPELSSALFESPSPGSIVGPIFAGGSVHLVRVQDVRQAEQPVIRARHILVRSSTPDPEIEQRLLDIRAQIEGGASFEAMARQHSQDNTCVDRR